MEEAGYMSDFIYSKITFGGESIEIMTPKHRPDAQHEHTVAYFAAYNELRHREADKVRPINDYIADMLDKPVELYSRENPAGLTVGSTYTGDKRLWRPAMPVKYWSAPKPLSDRQAAANAARIEGKAKAGKYAPKAAYPNPEQDAAFEDVLFEIIETEG
jgi:hypothetical protein